MIFRGVPQLSGLGASDTRSWGVALWEWWNPEQVQAEYAAVGKPVPTVEQIKAQAVYDATVATGESAGNVVEAFQNAGSAVVGTAFDLSKLLMIGAVAALVLFLIARK
jgi:hypothetical protein